MCSTILIRLLSPPNNRKLLQHQKRPTTSICVKSLRAFCHFAPYQQFFVTKNWYNLGSPPYPPRGNWCPSFLGCALRMSTEGRAFLASHVVHVQRNFLDFRFFVHGQLDEDMAREGRNQGGPLPVGIRYCSSAPSWSVRSSCQKMNFLRRGITLLSFFQRQIYKGKKWEIQKNSCDTNKPSLCSSRGAGVVWRTSQNKSKNITVTRL